MLEQISSCQESEGEGGLAEVAVGILVMMGLFKISTLMLDTQTYTYDKIV